MDCSICLEKIIKSNDHIKFCCKQNYHFLCIKTWVIENQKCPICRKLLDDKVLKSLKKLENNIKELELKEKRAYHIIETLMLDLQNIKERTFENLENIANMSTYIRTIELSPQFNYRRLAERRGALVLPIIIEECIYPEFCNCSDCLPNLS